MACNHDRLCPSNSVGTSIAAFSSPLFPSTLNLCSRNLASTPIRVTSPSVSTTSFTWDDVVRISDSQHSSTHPADLQGFFEKIRLCNRDLEKQSDFLPFVIEDQTVGYIKELNGQKCIWIGKRSQVKATYPGMLDLLVGGGLPHGLASKENLMKECEEEAGIPRSISKVAVSVGAVSYGDIDEYEYKRDVLFCYELKLPEDFIPKNQDGEVESFRCIPVSQVADVVRRTHLFKSNCSLVIIDFLFRHGHTGPDSLGYLELLQSLRSGDCS